MRTNHQDMVRTKLSKLIALLGAFALIGTLLAAPVGATTTSGNAACGGSVLVLRTLHIEAHPSKKVVRPGDKFTVHVKVTRPAHEDPLGNGVEFEPPASFPAENVVVGLSVWVGKRTYFWQVGQTDANGEDVLTLKVPRNAESGKAIASASARNWIKNDCPDILEDGYTNYLDFITIKPLG